jgi:hypothetical protein
MAGPIRMVILSVELNHTVPLPYPLPSYLFLSKNKCSFINFFRAVLETCTLRARACFFVMEKKIYNTTVVVRLRLICQQPFRK